MGAGYRGKCYYLVTFRWQERRLGFFRHVIERCRIIIISTGSISIKRSVSPFIAISFPQPNFAPSIPIWSEDAIEECT